MKKIGVLFGMENTFPAALVERINGMGVPDVTAEFVQHRRGVDGGALRLRRHHRPHLARHPVLPGVAEERGADAARASSTTRSGGAPTTSSSTTRWRTKLGVAVPPTVAAAAQGASDRHHRSLDAQPALPARLGRRSSSTSASPPSSSRSTAAAGATSTRWTRREEFFKAYDQTRDLVHDAAARR